MDPRFKHTFTMVLSGPTGSGKTEWVKRFIHNISSVMNPIPEEIVWCYAEWQKGYQELENQVHFHEGIPNFESWDTTKKRLVIIDDLMNETDERITRLFTKGSHHRNLSVIYLVQNFFNKNKHQRTITLNSHYLVLFKNPRDKAQISHLAKQMYPGNTAFVQEAFKQATERPFGYLLFDLRQETPDHLRLRSTIFPPEFQTVYVQK